MTEHGPYYEANMDAIAVEQAWGMGGLPIQPWWPAEVKYRLLTRPGLMAELEARNETDQPPCPRCRQPMHKIQTPPPDGAWVWGHDCAP